MKCQWTTNKLATPGKKLPAIPQLSNGAEWCSNNNNKNYNNNEKNNNINLKKIK